MANKTARGTEKGSRRAHLEAALAEQGIVTSDLPEIRRYLASHRDLARIVPRVCEQGRCEFGPEAELILKVYQDPEIDDRHLTLAVRLPAYDVNTITARMDSVTEPFEEELCSASGFILVMTDFRVPGTPYGI